MRYVKKNYYNNYMNTVFFKLITPAFIKCLVTCFQPKKVGSLLTYVMLFCMHTYLSDICSDTKMVFLQKQ